LLRWNPAARIILETPIGGRGESRRFTELTLGTAVVVQSQYFYAHVLSAFTDRCVHLSRMPLRIAVEFQKNQDQSGRFVDHER
jgi:hypothetical protein